jgi:pimeloyl-ACP methyl ester carboxylesterase
MTRILVSQIPVMPITDLKSPDGRITAARSGSGRDLIILHSLLTDRHAFDPVLPELSARFKVTLLNLPGFHGSKPVGGSMTAYTAFVRDAFDAFEIGRDATLMGNGFGGTVALAFALAHPDRVGRLVLADVAPGFPPEGKQAFRVMSEKVAAGGLGSIADIASNRVFHTDYLAKNPGAIGERRAVLLRIDPGAFRAACAALIDADLVAQLPQLKALTLVVFGELDQATPPALNMLIASKVPGARHVELKGCGHCPPLEQPRQFLAAIDDFIAA